MVLSGSLLARAEVALIIEVYAIRNRVESPRGAQLFHHYKKFVFALKASLPVIACVFRTVEFGGDNDFDGDSLLIGESDGVV